MPLFGPTLGLHNDWKFQLLTCQLYYFFGTLSVDNFLLVLPTISWVESLYLLRQNFHARRRPPLLGDVLVVQLQLVVVDLLYGYVYGHLHYYWKFPWPL